MNLDLTPFHLCEIFEEVEHVLAPEAAQKNLRISHLISSDVPGPLLGDPTRIRQLLTILAGNAVEFTEQGSVEFRAELVSIDGDSIHIRIEVEVTGIEIPRDNHHSILSGFSHVEEDPDHDSVDPGLSLSMCRQLAEIMGGSIGVSSGVGQGTLFRVELKLGKVNPRSFKPAISPGSSPDSPLAIPLLVLLAEDQLVNRMVACKLLERLGCEVVAVEDGLKALEALRSADYDLVLMDIQMPGMDGLAATVELRRRERETGRHLPVIAMLANDVEGKRGPCLAAGMDDFITKPIHPQPLREALEKWGRPDAKPRATSLCHFRWDFLDECCGSNREIANEVLQSVLDSVPQTLESIQQAIATTDLVSLGRLIHLLKGSCLTIGADLMVDVCEQLRPLLQSRMTDPIQTRFQQLLIQWQDLRTEILFRLAST